MFGVGGGLLIALLVTATLAEELAKPPKDGDKTFVECLWARRSTRRFSGAPLQEGVLARVLWCADGINREDAGKRTAPSAFAAYPIGIYVVESARVARYDPVAKSLVSVRTRSASEDDMRTLILGGSSFTKAPVILVLVADLAVFDERANVEMRLPWAHAECGAIGQNVYLACADLGLGTVFASASQPERMAKALGLEKGEVPCYVMPVGEPEATAAPAR